MVDEPSAETPLLPPPKVEFTPPKRCFQHRYVFLAMASMGFFNIYAMRVNLSVAMVAMVNQTQNKQENISNECPQDDINGSRVDTNQSGDFDWSPSLQGTILGAFFYGYVVTQIPGGYLSGKFGGKWFFGLGVLTTGILTLLTPIAAKTNVYLFIVLRVLEGIGEGVTYPTMHAMMGKWAPPHDRSLMLAIAYAGGQIGTAASMPITGYLCKYGFAGGWPSVFYIFGALSCLWFIFWVLLIHDSPSDHPWISEEEKRYIVLSIGDPIQKKQDPVPWRKILTSVPVWSMCAAHFGGSYIFYTLLTDLPTYLDVVLHFDLKQDGLLSALPYILNFAVNCISGILTDILLAKGVWRVTTARKVNTGLGLLLPAACMFGASFMGCDYNLGVALLALSTGFLGSGTSGYFANIVDIAPRYAGFCMGFINMFGNMTGIIAPLVVGQLTNTDQTEKEWNKIFYIASSIAVLAAIIYLIFGKAERQPWSYGKDDKLITDSMAEPHETPCPVPSEVEKLAWENSSEVLLRRGSPININ